MALVSFEEFREYVESDVGIKIKRVHGEAALYTATREIRELIGTAILAEVAADQEPYEDQSKDVREAQMKFAYREWLLFNSAKPRKGGLVEQENDGNGDTTNRYRPLKDTEEFREVLRIAAEKALLPYMTASSEPISPAPAFAVGKSTIDLIEENKFTRVWVGDRWVY